MKKPKTEPHYVEHSIKPTYFVTRYFPDGTIEDWLSNKQNDLLYLYRKYKYPSGQSPILMWQPKRYTVNPFPGQADLSYMPAPKGFQKSGSTE